MANVAQIEIQVDDSNAGAAVQRLNQKVQELDPAFRRVGESAYKSGEQIGMHYQKALASVEILRSSLGVRLPRALERVVARSELAGAALRAAFSVTAISFAIPVIESVGTTLVHVTEKAYALVEAMHGLTAAEQAAVGADHAQNSSKASLAKSVLDYQRALEAAGKSGTQLARLQVGWAKADVASQQAIVDRLQKQRDKLAGAAGQTVNVPTGTGGLFVTEFTDAAVAAQAKLKALDNQLDDAKLRLNVLKTASVKAGEALDKIGTASQQAGVRHLADAYARLKKTAGDTDVFLNQTIQQLAVLPGNQADVLTGFIDANQQAAAAGNAALAKQMNQTLDQLAKQSSSATARSTSNALDKFTYAVDSMRSRIQSFFQEITSGNIGQAFLRLFEGMIAKMVATWIVGMEGMRAATRSAYGVGGGLGSPGLGSGGMGGILGSLLGSGTSSGGATASSAFGFNSGLSSSAWTDLTGLPAPGSMGAAGSLASMVLPLSAGAGAGAASTVLPAGASTGSTVAAGGLLGAGGTLAKLFPHGLSIGGVSIGGAGLALMGAGLGVSGFMSLLNGGNTAAGALETIGGAALTGFSIGGPIGAVVGGIVGAIGSFFGWLFGSGKKKREREQLAQQLQDALKQVEDNYNLYQTDYSTARNQMEQLRQQYAQSEAKIGGSESKYVDPYVDKAINDINSTEAERLQRAALVFGPAQFRTGGFVSSSLAAVGPLPLLPSSLHFASGGAVPAILHAGEFVMRPEAVAKIGRPNLEQMNAGTIGDGKVEVHMHFPGVYDARGFEQTLLKNTRGIRMALRRIQTEGG